MTDIFLTVLRMDLAAAAVITIIIALRPVLRLFPKRYSYLLWSIPAFRLMFPFSFSSALSIFNISLLRKAAPAAGAAAASQAAAQYSAPPASFTDVQVTAPAASAAEELTAAAQSAAPSALSGQRVWLTVGAIVWLVGITVAAFFAARQYLAVSRATRCAVLTEDGLYQCENIGSPFVLGIIRPRIYIPCGLSPEETSCIVRHERIHIKHADHIVRLFALCLRCVHWFDPLVWIACRMMNSDMEMSCDESVLRESGGDLRREYSLLLLSFARVTGRRQSAVPVSFSQPEVLKRVKNILKYKKPAAWSSVIVVVLCAALFTCCISNALPEQTAQASAPEAGPGTPAAVQLPDDAHPDLLAQAETTFNPDNTGRAANILRSAGLIGTRLIAPGESFSFNAAVGERTGERGFTAVQSGEYDEFSEEFGCGVSQTSSTVCTAAKHAGLEIVEQHTALYYPMYRPEYCADASVTWGGDDLIIRNSTESEVALCVECDSGMVRCSIYGVSDGLEREIIFAELEMSQYPVIYRPSDGEHTDVFGVNGRTVASYMVISSDGVELERIKLNQATYRPQPRIVYTDELPEGCEYYISYPTPGNPPVDSDEASAVTGEAPERDFVCDFDTFEEFWNSRDAQSVLSGLPYLSAGTVTYADFCRQGEMNLMGQYCAETDFAEFYVSGVSAAEINSYINSLVDAGFVYGSRSNAELYPDAFMIDIYNAESGGIGVQIQHSDITIIAVFKAIDGRTGNSTPVPKG